MKGSTILVIALSFILVCSLAFGLEPLFRRTVFQERKGLGEDELRVDKSTSTALTFKAKANFDGETEDKNRFSDLLYEGSDGTRLSRRIVFYKTAQHAQHGFDQETNGAPQVLERSKKLEGAGVMIGDRAVILYYSDSVNQDKLRAKILWTKGSELHSIDAPSTEHAKALEAYETGTS